LECGDASPLFEGATRRANQSTDVSANNEELSGVMPPHSKESGVVPPHSKESGAGPAGFTLFAFSPWPSVTAGWYQTQCY
jgi:hypothetical protein